MRVRIVGGSDCACALRGYLQKAGDVALWKTTDAVDPDYTVYLEIAEGAFFLDSIECDLERSIFKHLRTLSHRHLEIRTHGGIQSDYAIRIVFPEAESRAVELAVQMGFADFAGPPPTSPVALTDSLKKLESLYERMLAEKDQTIAQLKPKRWRWLPWRRTVVMMLLSLALFSRLHSQGDGVPPSPPPDLPLPLEPSDRERLKDLWVEGFLAFARVEDANLAAERFSRQAAEAKLDGAKRQKELDEINAKISSMIGDFRNKYKASTERWCLTRQLSWLQKGEKPCPAIFESEPASSSRP